jgi:penicillin-binding protein 1A
MVAAYSTFANQGVYETQFISKLKIKVVCHLRAIPESRCFKQRHRLCSHQITGRCNRRRFWRPLRTTGGGSDNRWTGYPYSFRNPIAGKQVPLKTNLMVGSWEWF